VLPPLPRWTRHLRFTLTSVPPTAFLVIMASRHPRRPFEACSVFTYVAARMARWPPKEAFSRSASVHSLPPEPPLVLLAGARVGQVGIAPTDQSCLTKAHTTTPSRMQYAQLPLARKTGSSPDRSAQADALPPSRLCWALPSLMASIRCIGWPAYWNLSRRMPKQPDRFVAATPELYAVLSLSAMVVAPDAYAHIPEKGQSRNR
jgi:hypothetical protein